MNRIDTFVAAAGLAGDSRSADSREAADFVAAHLTLAHGARILDMPCGNGRVAVLLARKGYRVVGADVSRTCIRIARAKSAHPNVRYVATNINTARGIGEQFDAVISLFTCIGYFASDAENVEALRSLTSVLPYGGTLILSTANQSVSARQSGNVTMFATNGFHIRRADHYDARTRFMTRRFAVLDRSTGTRRTYVHRQRLYSNGEMLSLLRSCGMAAIRCFADYRGTRFDGNRSPHVVFIGTKHG
jgi:cyclopropane fatty-acyl-phospholipid synthase-like methyltransferase